jgi:Ankyrin repeats (3 copies)
LSDWRLFKLSFRNASLHQAVNIGDAKAIEAMMADGADVNARNESGQTPIIHAIIAGQYHLLSVLLKAGANPSQRDNTGLNAIDWAERKGRSDLAQSLSQHGLSHHSSRDVAQVDPAVPATQPPAETTQPRRLSADEKSRRFIAGLKQRIDEQANRESAIQQPPPEKPISRDKIREPQPAVREIPAREELIVEPVREVIPTVKEQPTSAIFSETRATLQKSSAAASTPTDQKISSSSHLKRCPQCGATYDSELLGYCAFHVVELVNADAPIPAIAETRSSWPMIWILVLIAVFLGALGGFLVTKDFSNNETIGGPAPALPEPVSQKGMPLLGRQLDGKAASLPQAEIPANTVKEPATVIVRVRINREGRVFAASSDHGNQVLRDAAIEAARKSTFLVERLRGRNAEGTISYTFK